MRLLLKEWLKAQKPVVIVGHDRVESLFVCETYEFMKQGGKFCRISLVYNDVSVIGKLGEKDNVLAIEGERGSRELLEPSVHDIFSRYVETYDSKDELLKTRKKLDKAGIDKYISLYIQNIIEGIYKVRCGNFYVESVNINSDKTPILVVKVRKGNEAQLPVRLWIGEPTPVRARNYGVESVDFKDFVEEMGSLVGKIFWY